MNYQVDYYQILGIPRYATPEEIKKKFSDLCKYDFLRTLVKFTAESICYNISTYILDSIDEVVLSGGGSHHALLVKDLNENFSNLYFMDKYKISVDNKESFLMAVLCYTCYNRISNNMPSVTGASGHSIYGEIYE